MYLLESGSVHESDSSPHFRTRTRF